MTIRHTLITLAAAAISAVALLASCSSSEAKRAIAAADSLAVADPSAAVTLADSVLAGDGLSRADRMKLALLKAKAQNTLGMAVNKDTMRLLTDYYGSSGTPNDRMTVKYIQGCQYMDAPDAPKTFECFQEAARSVDTLASNNCDFNTLSRVYGQMCVLLQEQMSPINALESGRAAIKYAMIAKDTLYAVSVYSFLASVYHQMGITDSVMSITMKAAELYEKYGTYRQAAAAYGVLIFTLVDKGKIKEAKPYMDFYEQHSGLFDKSKGYMLRGHEIYYYPKGRYYLYENKLDSAEYFFRKELYTTSDFNNLQAAAKGLYLLYKQIGITDSIIKYSEMMNAATDSSYMHMSTRHLQQMQAMYDYTRNERIAEQKESEAMRYKYLALTFVFAFVSVVFILLFISQKRKKETERTKKLNATNAMYFALLKTKGAELEIALNKNVRDDKLIEEKTAEIAELQEKLAELRGETFDALHSSNSKIFDAPIVEHLHELAGTSSKATKGDLACLKQHADDVLPDFMQSLKIEKTKLSSTELLVCIFVKLQFMTSEMSCLLGVSPQYLANMRMRLNKKVFGLDGGAKDFDYRVKRLLPTS